MKLRKTSPFQAITSVYIYALLSIWILWCGTNGYQGIQEAKYHIFMLLCGGYVLVMILCAAELLVIGQIHLISPKTMWKNLTWSQRLVIIYMLLTWISAITSAYFPETIRGVSRNEGALTITVYGVCFLLISAYGKLSESMLWEFGAVITLFDILCIAQLFGLNPLGLYPEGMNYFGAYTSYSGAYLGTIGNVDLVAAFLCLAIPILWITLLRWSEKRKWFLLLPLVLSVFVLIRMAVMAGIVGVFVGGVLCLPFVLPGSKKCRLAVGLTIIVCAAAALLILWSCDFQIELLHEIHELLHGTVNDSFGSSRIYIWKNVLNELRPRLLFGYGPDTMLYGGIASFTRYDASLGGTIVSQIDVAHNEYLNILYHQGIFALAAYIAMLAISLGKWLRTAVKSPIAAIMGGGVLCYLVQAFFGFSMCITAPLFWLVFALLERELKTENLK